MIRTVIVDDEPPARRTLRTRLRTEADFQIVAEAAGGREALAAIREHGPDLVFLDIKMPDISGFDVLRQLGPDELPFIVFVTAYDQFALKAFEANALAYLLKPFDDVRFQEVLDHCRRFFQDGVPNASHESLVQRIRTVLDAAAGSKTIAARPGGRGRIVVKGTGRTRLVDLDDIDWIEAEGNYARLHCAGDAQHLVSRSLGELEGALDSRFVRIHRSTIVNLERVTELRTENYRDFIVQLENGESLRLSRTYREAVEEALGDRI